MGFQRLRVIWWTRKILRNFHQRVDLLKKLPPSPHFSTCLCETTTQCIWLINFGNSAWRRWWQGEVMARHGAKYFLDPGRSPCVRQSLQGLSHAAEEEYYIRNLTHMSSLLSLYMGVRNSHFHKGNSIRRNAPNRGRGVPHMASFWAMLISFLYWQS